MYKKNRWEQAGAFFAPSIVITAVFSMFDKSLETVLFRWLFVMGLMLVLYLVLRLTKVL